MATRTEEGRAMDINREINRLLHFARQQGLLQKTDEVYAANRLLDCLRVP